jgi:hypothetical protein
VLATGLSESELSFYSTAAQVIPVFFLALVLELPTVRTIGWQLGARRAGSPLWVVVRFVIFAIVVLMFAAEFTALANLKNDNASSGARGWVMLGLIAGGIPLLLAALDRLMPEVIRASREDNGASEAIDNAPDPPADEESSPPGPPKT